MSSSIVPPPAMPPTTPRELPPYGLVAEFATAQALVDAAAQTRDAGYRRTEAYSPFPVEGLTDALGQRPTKLPLVVLIGGIVGTAAYKALIGRYLPAPEAEPTLDPSTEEETARG